jgi:hypothetical protein
MAFLNCKRSILREVLLALTSICTLQLGGQELSSVKGGLGGVVADTSGAIIPKVSERFVRIALEELSIPTLFAVTTTVSETFPAVRVKLMFEMRLIRRFRYSGMLAASFMWRRA